MKRFIVSGMLLTLGIMLVSGISPYIRVAETTDAMDVCVDKVIGVLEKEGYDIIGEYKPGNQAGLYVVVFTSEKIKKFCRKSEDRGMLAAAMKVGFQKTEDKITISILNPEYIFYAYFRDAMNQSSVKSEALGISNDIKGSMKSVGNLMEPFGGDLSSEDLAKYRYMAGMPNFEKKVKLAEFNRFEIGLAAIRTGLAGEADTRKVYEIIDESSQTAVFGIGLTDKEKGEAHFLPIIGESHVAAMPYEIILQDNKVTMLHGRYRFALHWPELTMGTFTKIMSSPGDVADAMQDLFDAD